ncbi:MAG: carbohydrate ABC transporter permease [Anaerolineae bacterium]|nr:MAG: carbohydrate ABC transporter permease [Anaerolineae bacterium]
MERYLAERGERRYTGPYLSDDLSSCRTAGQKLAYFWNETLLSNYRSAWVTARFSQYVWNSVRITAVTIIGLLIVCTLAAYAFARMSFPGRNFIFTLLMATMMLPETVTMIPNFLTITGNNPFLPFIKWYDSLPALTIPFMASFFNIFLLRQFFAQVPNELWDAAQIDGAGHLRFLVQVVLPIAVGLQNFVTEAGPQTHLWMAGASISMIPVLLLYFLAQKQFIEGIATTGLKG